MNAQQIFRTDAGALRAPWRLVVFALVSTVALIVVDVFVGPVIAFIFSSIGLVGVTNEEWVSVIALLLSTGICIRYVDGRPWRDVWLDRSAARPRLLGAGFAIGALAIAIPTLLLIAVGWLRNDGGTTGSWLGAAVRVTVLLLPAAFFEELFTRGYALSVLVEVWGWGWAVAATSVVFGLMHLANPGARAEAVALVTLAGFFLAAVLWKTRSLYAAWMAHFAWNWTMAVLFHTAVSGLPMERPDYGYVDAGPDWATGGQWGPEGGVPAALGMVAGMTLLFANRRRASTRRVIVTDLDKPES